MINGRKCAPSLSLSFFVAGGPLAQLIHKSRPIIRRPGEQLARRLFSGPQASLALLPSSNCLARRCSGPPLGRPTCGAQAELGRLESGKLPEDSLRAGQSPIGRNGDSAPAQLRAKSPMMRPN